MRQVVVFGPSVAVFIAVALTLIVGPSAVRQIHSARIEAEVMLAQQRLDDDSLLERINQATRDVADAVAPSVVFIQTRTGRFGGGAVSSGSGWVFDDEGHIITNAHVIQESSRIEVQFVDSRSAPATFVGMDRSTDIAIIKVDPDDATLIPARRGTNEPIYQGDTVFAFGSPFGFKFSMSRGIVSGLGREARASSNTSAYTNFIQTDAAVNPGNSGGPLVDVNGRVIGMNTAIITDADGADSYQRQFSGVSGGIGFAIPLDTIESVARQLIEDGVVYKGYLGVSLAFLPAEVAEDRLGYSGGECVVISDFSSSDSPARIGGLQVNDVITHVNGRQTPSMAVLRSAVANAKPNETVTFSVWREGRELKQRVKLGAARIAPDGTLLEVDSDAVGTRRRPR